MFDFLADFDERMENISVFYPIFKLQGAQKYPQYDIFSLGISTLLFLLDVMLKGKEGCDSKELAYFLRDLLNFNYAEELTEEETTEIVYYLLDMLRNGGKPFEITYQNPYNKGSRRHKVVLIEIASYEPNRPIKYRLSIQGLDLMFKTREIYRELRITISQIYLKQQIERGVFHEAIRTVDDLRLQVKDLHERMRQFTERLYKNVLDVDIKVYSKLYEDIFRQIQREQQVFDEIKTLLTSLYQNLQAINPAQMTSKEKTNLEYVISLSQKLDRVINEHNILLKERIDLSHKYYEAMETQFSMGFRTKIDFELEIVDEIINKNTDIDHLASVLSPLFSLRHHKGFNIHKVFAEQRIDEKREERQNVSLKELDVAAAKAGVGQRDLEKIKKDNYRYYMKMIFDNLELMQTKLSVILESLEQEDYYKVINSFDFYSFLISMHQTKAFDFAALTHGFSDDGKFIDLERIAAEIKQNHPNLDNFNRLDIIGSDEVISMENGFTVTNYIFRLGR
jgi:hypothetical protein